MVRLSDLEIKAKVIERSKLQRQRDALTVGLSPDAITANPMGALTRIRDMMQAFRITTAVEVISDELVMELALRVSENGGLPSGEAN